jgi:hypothetical protein
VCKKFNYLLFQFFCRIEQGGKDIWHAWNMDNQLYCVLLDRRSDQCTLTTEWKRILLSVWRKISRYSPTISFVVVEYGTWKSETLHRNTFEGTVCRTPATVAMVLMCAKIVSVPGWSKDIEVIRTYSTE